MTKNELVYEISKKRHTLEFELQSCEFHRKAIEKRIKEIQVGFFYYVGILLGVPAFLSFAEYLSSLMTILTPLRALFDLAQIAFAFTIPVWVFQIFKCVLLEMQNRDKEILITPPSPRHPIYQKKRPPEPNIRAEFERVNWVCQRYLYFLEEISVLESRINLVSTEEEYDEIYKKLEEFPLYEEITPAPSFPKNEQGGKIVFICIAISIVVVFSLIAILDPFGTMRFQ